MITAPAAELRANFEGILSRRRGAYVSLAHVPAEEWGRFRAKDGPFTDEDWRGMPVLFGELTKAAQLSGSFA